MDEGTHDSHPRQHRQPGEKGHLQGAGLGEPDRLESADGPTDLGGTNVGRNGRDGGEHQHVNQIERPDDGFFALDGSPGTVGVGEESHYVLDHGLTS